MARYSEYQDALPPVYHNGQESILQRDAVARLLSGTRVPPEHVASLSAIHTGAQMCQGAGALYDHDTRAILLRGNPDRLTTISPGMRTRQTRTIVHETGHHVSHVMNPVQFGQHIVTPTGRGLLEAHAENYADQALPGSYSGYDYEANKGHMPASYQQARGPRFGNIDPRLR